MVQLLPNHFETLINQLSSNSHAIKVSILVKTNQMEDSKLSAQQPCMHLVSVLLYSQHITKSPITTPVNIEKTPQTIQ